MCVDEAATYGDDTATESDVCPRVNECGIRAAIAAGFATLGLVARLRVVVSPS